MRKGHGYLLDAIAKSNYVDSHDIARLYELLLPHLKNPYYITQYLTIKSIDHRIAKRALSSNDMVLDIGCGIPITAIVLHSWGIKNVVSIDLDKESVEIGKQFFKKLGIHYQILQMDALDLKFPDDTFDTSLSFSAIEHLPDTKDHERWLKEITRVTKRGGSIVLTTSNAKNFPMRWLAYLAERRGGEIERFFYPSEMTLLMEKEELEIVDFDSGVFWYSNYLFRFIPKARVSRYSLTFDLAIEKLGRLLFKRFGARMGFIAKKK